MIAPQLLVAMTLFATAAADSRGGEMNCVSTIYDAEKVRQALAEIRDGFRRNQERLSDVRLAGTLEPGNREFVWISNGGCARLDVQFDSSRGRVWMSQLHNGRRMLQLYDGSLSIYPLGLKNFNWHGLGQDVFKFTTRTLGDDAPLDVAEQCELLDRLILGRGIYRQTQPLMKSGAMSITVQTHRRREEPGTRCIFISHWDSPGTFFELTVDAAQGYQPVRYSEVQCQPDPSEYLSTETIENDFQQLPNGGWAPHVGRYTVCNTGRLCEREGRTPRHEQSMRVTSAAVLDFSQQNAALTAAALEFQPGLEVHDYRYAPPRSFQGEEAEALWRELGEEDSGP